MIAIGILLIAAVAQVVMLALTVHQIRESGHGFTAEISVLISSVGDMTDAIKSLTGDRKE